MRQSEKLRQIGLGVQLRKLRENAGMSTRSVASAMGLSPSSVNRNELGLRAPSREEVTQLCVLFGVNGAERQRLIDRVGEIAETAAWLESGHISDDLASLIVLEREAERITNVAMSLVHGLGQTAEYARLVLGSGYSGNAERQVVTRLGRQAILTRPKAPQVRWLLHEGVLHRTLGDERVLRSQLEHLVSLQRRDNVSIQVIPFNAPASPAHDSPFSLYELVDGSPYVFAETPGVSIFVSESAKVTPFVETCRMLRSRALDEQASVALIRKVAEGLAID